MLFALLVFVITAASLIVLLWVGTLFLQGYIYTEPTQGIAWQAPAAGAALALFLTLWCLLVRGAHDPAFADLPYDAFHRFSPTVEKYKEPVAELSAVHKGSKEPTRYERKKTVDVTVRTEYREKNRPDRRWKSTGVEAIIIKEGNQEITFRPAATPEGGPAQFRDAAGWTMSVYVDGPTGIPTMFRWGRFFANLFLNVFHVVLWFVCLWLLLRFQWSHALGMAIVLWLVVTIAFLPMMLNAAVGR